MNIRTLLCLCAALFLSLINHAAGEIAAGEKAKIEALIGKVSALEGAKFIRNGSDYDAKTAATFLRRKWTANEGEIHTAADFIAKAATASGTTGKPYLIKMKEGSEVKCAEFLSGELAKLAPK
jgi:hypothetical protein